MEPKNGFTNPLPYSFLSAHCVFFWLLLGLAIAGAVWFLAGIARVFLSEEFRADVDRLRNERRSKRGKHLLGLLALVALLTGVATGESVGQPRTFTVPFHTVKGMMLLDATVNGKPAALLLDTGADATTVSPQASSLSTVKLRALTATKTPASIAAYIKMGVCPYPLPPTIPMRLIPALCGELD